MKEDLKNYLPKMDSWLIPRENGMLLSDYQVSVLQKNGIDYLKYSNISLLLMEINEILDEDDDEELEIVAKEIDESNYYNNTNK